jgi:hypothetical protein
MATNAFRSLLLILAGVVVSTFAQTMDTAILGVVSDPSSAAVPGAQVTITQPATGFVQKVTTNTEGAFEVRYLRPGEYTVDVTAGGFAEERRTNVIVQTGQTVRLNFALQVGQVSQKAEVVAEVPLMQTENASLGEVVSTERVTNLPLNGRRFVDLAALTPGVTVRTESQFSLVKANGTRDTTMNLSFDGVQATANRWAFVAIFPPLDSIQEFRVQTGNYTAEYGGNAGANVNVQLRSGSNSWHGNMYEFLRNDALDARNYFSPAPLPKDVLRRNQFGAVLSGPIKKDKAFFMAGWESQRNIQESAGGNITLTQAQRNGDFSNLSTPITDPFGGLPFPQNKIPSNRLDPVSVNLASTYLPLPNVPGEINYAYLSRANTNWDQGLARLDYRWSERDQFSGHYMGHNWDQLVIPPVPAFQSESPYLNQNVAAQWVHTFSPVLLNEFRFGYHRGSRDSTNPRKNTDFTASQVGINGLKQGGPNGRELTQAEAGFPTIDISGYLGMGETGGSDVDKTQTYQFVDNVSIFHGKHALKMGVDISRHLSNANTINWPYGQITFTSDISGDAGAAYMLGFPRETLTPEGQPVSAVRQWRNFFYFQDDWRVTPRLTLNLGVRYDMLTLPHEINGNSRTLRWDLDPSGPVLWPPDSRTSAEGQGTVVDLWENEHWHICPRFGFAYRADDRTVIRGGYGIFTAVNQFDHVNVLQLNPPMAGSITVINPTTNPVATIEYPVPVALVGENPLYNVVSMPPNRQHINPYVQNWNFQVSRQIGANNAIEAGYVGNKATFLDTSQLNYNSPDPGPGDIQSRRPYQDFNRIRLLTTDGNSTYHALQARFEHRFSRGLSFTANYNWSHMIDDQEDETNGSRCQCQDPRHRGLNDKASSILDIRHRFIAGYVWEIPFGENLHGIAQAVLGGWGLGGIIQVQSGSPFRINQASDTQNNDSVGAARPNLVPGQSVTISQQDPSYWFNTNAFTPSVYMYGNTPRNPLVGPGLNVWSLSAQKAFKIPRLETHSLQFRAELFNAFNTPQFGNPGSSVGNGDFGQVTSTRADNRQIQFGLRYQF